MADESISFKITADGSLAISELDKVKGKTAALGADVDKHGRSMKLAFWGVGESAENLAQSLGVPNQMSRQLGNAVEGLVAKMGAGAVAFGAVSLAAMAAYGIYQHFAEANKKAAEEAKKLAEEKSKVRVEILRAAESSAVWLASADKNLTKTNALVRAEEELYKIERKRNIANLNKGILEQQNEILDLKQKSMDFVVLEYNGQRVVMQQSAQVNTTLAQEIKYREKKIALMQEQVSSAASGGPEESHANALIAIERDKYNAIQELRWLNNQDAIKDRELQMAAEKQLADYKMNTAVSTLTAIDSITKGKYKGIFYAIKGMQAAQAIIHGEAASVAALAPPPVGLGPVHGAPVSVWARAAGYAAAAAIMAQTFSGGSKAGSTAVGTYSANQNTGLPENGGYKYFNYEQSTYGSGWRPGSAGGGTTIIYAMDSKDVMDVLMENPKAVAKSYALSQKGYA